MQKKRYGVIGHPIGHSMSPFIHRRLFELDNIEADYEVYDISPDQLEKAVREELFSLDGFNVTIPYKKAIIPLLEKTDMFSSFFGSVNTVADKKGYTTDGYGLLTALDLAGIKMHDRVVILGTGGVSRIMAFHAAIAGCDITLAVRPQGLRSAAALAGEIRTKFRQGSIRTSYLDRLDGDIDLLLNGTPVGMYPNTDACPVSDDVIKRCLNVFDAVYNPLETVLLKKAKSFGVNTIDGMSMLVLQAVKAHEIWNSSFYKKDDILQLIEDSKKELKRTFGTK